MKTAISVPDHVFERAERLAKRSGRSRSELYSTALAEYVARHELDEVTAAVDRVIEALSQEDDAFVAAAASQVLRETEW
jgi:predicted transcriptional regulator